MTIDGTARVTTTRTAAAAAAAIAAIAAAAAVEDEMSAEMRDEEPMIRTAAAAAIGVAAQNDDEIANEETLVPVPVLVRKIEIDEDSIVYCCSCVYLMVVKSWFVRSLVTNSDRKNRLKTFGATCNNQCYSGYFVLQLWWWGSQQRHLNRGLIFFAVFLFRSPLSVSPSTFLFLSFFPSLCFCSVVNIGLLRVCRSILT
jgi:hypothetical protein